MLQRLSSLIRRSEDTPPSETAVTALPGLDAVVTPDEREILERCRPHTMTSEARLLALIDAVRHLVQRETEGAFVECGVWRGGSVLAMILTLQQLEAADRDIYLFDTFQGMTEPTEHDTSPFHAPALTDWQAARRSETRPWGGLFNSDLFNRESVERTLHTTGYPSSQLHFREGDVLETIPAAAPNEIALLRLDTDWYESTRHELEHLYPRLSTGGVLIIDDYGHWEGARRAVDEYFGDWGPLLHRIDYTGRAAIKEA